MKKLLKIFLIFSISICAILIIVALSFGYTYAVFTPENMTLYHSQESYENRYNGGNVCGAAWRTFPYEYKGMLSVETLKEIYPTVTRAKDGDPEALYSLGMAYLHGEKTPKDEVSAFNFLLSAVKSSKDKHIKAVVKLGDMFRDGIGTEKREDVAVSLYAIAGKSGDAIGADRLGQMLRFGQGVKKRDIPGAIFVFNQAIEKGYRNAAYHMGTMFLEGKYVPLSSFMATLFFYKALPHDKAAEELGRLYEEGKSISPNHEEALKHYCEALGQPTAMRRIAAILENRNDADSKAEAKWWKQEADKRQPRDYEEVEEALYRKRQETPAYLEGLDLPGYYDWPNLLDYYAAPW